MDSRLILTVFCGAAEFFALCRLVLCGVSRSYPWFVAYLAAGFAQSFVWLAGGPKDPAYAFLYAVTMPIIVALRIAIVLEFWRALMSKYSGIENVSKSLGLIVVVLAFLISLAGGFDTLHIWGVPWNRSAYHAVSLAIRYSGSVLCIVCSLLSLFAVCFREGVPSNLIRHGFLLTAYFGSIAAGFVVMNLVRGSAPLVGAIMTGSAAGLYVLWGLLLTRPGEGVHEASPVTREDLDRIGRLHLRLFSMGRTRLNRA